MALIDGAVKPQLFAPIAFNNPPSKVFGHPGPPRVLDVGTGTGAWIKDLDSILPQVQFEGRDLETANFYDHVSVDGIASPM